MSGRSGRQRHVDGVGFPSGAASFRLRFRMEIIFPVSSVCRFPLSIDWPQWCLQLSASDDNPMEPSFDCLVREPLPIDLRKTRIVYLPA